jgi:DNA repair protein RadC
MAHGLLSRFGGLAGLFSGQDGELAEAVGQRPDILHQLRLLGDLVGETLRGRAEQQQVLFPTPETVIDFVRFDMLGRRRETLRVFYLDSGNHLLSDDIMAEGSVASLTFYPREIIRRALEVDASAMIMVHNHPCASPQPSLEDIRATRTTAALAAQMDIRLHDHLVVARRGWSSMRADGHV